MKLDFRKLHQLKDNLQKNILKKAIRAGAKLVLAAVRRRVPVKSGTLRRALATKVDAIRGTVSVYGLIGVRRRYSRTIRGRLVKPSRYAHFIELGRHARPYLRPAWEAGRAGYIAAVADVVAREIETTTR